MFLSNYRNIYNEVDQYETLRIKINSLYDLLFKTQNILSETELYNYSVKVKLRIIKKLNKQIKFKKMELNNKDSISKE